MKLIVIPFTILFITSCLGTNASNLKDRVAVLRDFEEIFSKNSETTDISIWKKGKYYLEITSTKDLQLAEGVKLIKIKKDLVYSVFDPKPSPYFPAITKRIICPKEFFPKIVEEKNSKMVHVSFFMDANERRTFGGCDHSNRYYKMIKVLTFCKDEMTLYEIDFYIPQKKFHMNDYENLKVLSCF
jgi:hypothetical protein